MKRFEVDTKELQNIPKKTKQANKRSPQPITKHVEHGLIWLCLFPGGRSQPQTVVKLRREISYTFMSTNINNL